MSILIDELEARKNDYILVADVIGAMADATNSATDEVVRYLDAHNIDEQLILLYMDESYNFEPYEGYFLGLGNDANITYFQKSDVMNFEPIIKHGIFKDGSSELLNPYQRNLDDDYLTLDEVRLRLSNDAGIDSGYNYEKIRDLARKKKITPCFYFSGYVCGLTQDNFSGLAPILTENPYTEIMTGYFTYRLLVEQISGEENYITLPHCEVGNEILIYKLLERQGDTNIGYKEGLALFEGKPQPFDNHKNHRNRFSCISFDEIRFSKRELESYITSIQPNNDNDDQFIEHVKLVNDDKLKQLDSLKTENDDLNSRLSIARKTYKQHQDEIKALKEKNEKLEAEKVEFLEQMENQTDAPTDDDILQTILDNSLENHAPDLKHAIQLWIDLYIKKNVGGGSHSAMANNWIYKNTGYDSSENSSPVKRLREISTPLKDFGGQRPKEVKK